MAKSTRGSGSLYQIKDKTWVYQYMEEGKRRTKRFDRKSDAQAFINARGKYLAAPSTTGSGNSGPLITVGDWMDQWLEVYAKPVIKLSTYTSYEGYVRGHIKPLLGQKYLNLVTNLDMQKFFNQRAASGNLKGGSLSPKTLRNLRNMLHLAFDQAVKCGLITSNPTEGVRLPKDPRKEMRVLSQIEQNRLIWAAKAMPEPAAFGIIFTLFTGVRIGELCGLRWKNVNLEQKAFRVCETRNRLPNFDDLIPTSTSVRTVQSVKTDNSFRVVYMMDELCHDMKSYKTIQDAIHQQYPGYNPEGYVFCQENGSPYEPRTYQDLFKRCVRRAGIPDANFHALRHTFATRALEHGMDVVTLSRILGHANPSITLDKYGHAQEEQKKRSINQMGDIYQHTTEQRLAAQEAEIATPKLPWGW